MGVDGILCTYASVCMVILHVQLRYALDEKYRFSIAETMLKLKNTYGFRIVSVLKFQVSASFRNAES